MFIPFVSFAMQQDSIGTKTENGIVYILHKVDKGQTLYAIARKYNVDVNEIIKANPGSDKGIQADAIIMVPTKKKTVSTSPVPNGETKIETKFHTVQAGETLYKIATMYGVSVSDIQKWNGLSGESISVGQRLAVSPHTASIAIPEQTPKPIPPTEPVKIEQTPVKPAQEPIKVVEPITEKISNENIVNNNKVEGNPSDENNSVTVPTRQIKTVGDEMVENGSVSISSEGDLSQERNFIMHPTARIGTIVMITNPENGKSAFARVVANYKAPGNEVVKINPTLAKKIGITESTKEVRVNYAK